MANHWSQLNHNIFRFGRRQKLFLMMHLGHGWPLQYLTLRVIGDSNISYNLSCTISSNKHLRNEYGSARRQQSDLGTHIPHSTGLLPDTYIYRLRMCRECRERFPCHQRQRKPLVSDPGMHHGTCGTHVTWGMSGSLNRCGGGNVPDMRNTKFYVFGKRPIKLIPSRWYQHCGYLWNRTTTTFLPP